MITQPFAVEVSVRGMNIKNLPKSIKGFFGKYWKKWTILVVLAMLIYIGFIFYQYVYKPIYQLREVSAQRFEIEKNIYEQIMDSYSKVEENINKTINKDYSDPFK